LKANHDFSTLTLDRAVRVMTDLASSRPGQPSQRGGRVRLRTLILIRWIAVAGQAAALGALASSASVVIALFALLVSIAKPGP